MSIGILPLSNDNPPPHPLPKTPPPPQKKLLSKSLALLGLKLKHSEQQELHYKTLLQSPMKEVHSRVYDNIDEALVMKAAMKTKGGCVSSWFDADNLRRILASESFGSWSLDLRK